MFREKLTKNLDERGYLYIRESYYERDGRTLKRKPKKLCDGSATKNRHKYSKKRDIYCGKIKEKEIEILENFEDFYSIVQNNQKEFTIFKIESTFEELLDTFIDYLLYVYKIDKQTYEKNTPKHAYALGDGFLSPIIISWLLRFNINGSCDNPNEIQRFTYRCQDCGIFDEEIINILYLKLVPDTKRQEITQEIRQMQKSTQNPIRYKGLYDFLKKG